MYALRETQFAFADAVIHGGTDILPQLRTSSLPAARRMSVYRNNFYSNLASALAATYPVVRRLVGNDYFDQVAREYVRTYPSVSGDLQEYGEIFPDFLHVRPETESLPYLRDVAQLEWAWQEVFHADAGLGAFDVQGLSALAPEQQDRLGFRLNPASRLLYSRFPSLRIWQVNQEDFEGDAQVSLTDGGNRLLVLQHPGSIGIHALTNGDYLFLKSLARGLTLTGAYECVRKQDPAFDLGSALQKHVQLGSISGWQLQPDFISTPNP